MMRKAVFKPGYIWWYMAGYTPWVHPPPTPPWYTPLPPYTSCTSVLHRVLTEAGNEAQKRPWAQEEEITLRRGLFFLPQDPKV